MRVSLVEMMVFNPPKGMKNWRAFRIEYGGHAESCIHESMIWLPPDVNLDMIDKLEEMLSGGSSDGYEV
jgi:hypothetical protein